MTIDEGQATGWPASPLAVAVGLLQADAPAAIMGVPEDWPRWAVLLPHVLAATDAVDDRTAVADAGPGRDALADECSWLLDRAATYLQVQGGFGDARPLAERALTITEAVHGPDHPTVATRLNNLALILRDLGEVAAARPLAERALAIDEAVHGPDHPTVALRLNNLALILQDLGEAAARPLAERALTIAVATLGPGHPYTAIHRDVLAAIVRDLDGPEAR